MNSTLSTMRYKPQFAGLDFYILGRHHIMTLNKLNMYTKKQFDDGYLSSVLKYNSNGLPLANNILRNY